MPSAAAHLQELLGLDDDELLAVLDADPLEVITGELERELEALRPYDRPHERDP